MPRYLSAPGKLFLAGEYAVLWGGVARLIGVGPRAWATCQSREGGEVELRLREGRLRGRRVGADIEWEQAVSREFLFAVRTLEVAARAFGHDERGLELALSASRRAPNGAKLGLGSSARAAVLTAEACRLVWGSEENDALDDALDDALKVALKVALLAHTWAQGGKGSGGDVAASFAGGLLRYRRFSLEGAPGEGESFARFTSWLTHAPNVAVEPLPSTRLTLLYASACESASTPGMVAQVESRLGPEERARFVRASDALGERFESGLLGNDVPALREVCEELSALLRTLGPLETPALTDLMTLARDAGAAAKISGAGGGDGCLLFCESDEIAARISERLVSQGATVFRVTSEPGLRLEQSVPAGLFPVR